MKLLINLTTYVAQLVRFNFRKSHIYVVFRILLNHSLYRFWFVCERMFDEIKKIKYFMPQINYTYIFVDPFDTLGALKSVRLLLLMMQSTCVISTFLLHIICLGSERLCVSRSLACRKSFCRVKSF